MGEHIAGYMGHRAETEMRSWEKTHKSPAFVRILEQMSGEKYCKNCAGNGSLLVSFCSHGPRTTVFPPIGKNQKPSLYFEGSHKWREGWYLISHTEGYTCERCEGTGLNADYIQGPFTKGNASVKKLSKSKDINPSQADA